MIRYKIKEKIKGIKPKIEEILKSIKFVLNRIGFVAFSCLLVIMILIIFKKITLIEVVTRLVTFMIFWVLVLIVIFGPRRYLLKSRTFKYICLIVLKKYPVIYYYRRALTGVLTPGYFIINDYMGYYIKRAAHLIFIGTGHVGIKPYFSLTKEESLLRLTFTMEIGNSVTYLYLYISKIFYEIIYFYDRKSIKEIIKSRVMAYFIITVLFYVLGSHGFKIYIFLLLVVATINKIVNIYLTYIKEKKHLKENRTEKDFKDLGNPKEQLRNAIIIHGYTMQLSMLGMQVDSLRDKTILMYCVITNKKIKLLGRYMERNIDKFLPVSIGMYRTYNSETKKYETDCFNFNAFPKKYYGKHNRNNGIIKDVHFFKGIDSLYKKIDFMSYEIYSEFTVEGIEKYNECLIGINDYISLINSFQEDIKEVINLDKQQYYFLARKVEIAYKRLLLGITLSDEFSEEDWLYYIEMMTEFGKKFIELKQFAKIAKKFAYIVKKEGGRLKFIEKNLKYISIEIKTSQEAKNQTLEYMKAIRSLEKKYNG